MAEPTVRNFKIHERFIGKIFLCDSRGLGFFPLKNFCEPVDFRLSVIADFAGFYCLNTTISDYIRLSDNLYYVK